MSTSSHIFDGDGRLYIDGAAIDQFYTAMKEPYSVKGALMPDAHLGYGLPIGGVVATEETILPSWVGYDIGCGMCAVRVHVKKELVQEYAQAIFNRVYEMIPTGFNHNNRPSKWDYSKLEITPVGSKIFEDKGGLCQMATLGSGNHFIEIGYDEDDVVWIVIHSGSRGVGHGIATHYMKIAGGGKAKEGNWPLDTKSQDGKGYIIDMNFALEFALENRKQMISRVVEAIACATHNSNILTDSILLGSDEQIINRNHNHAELRDGLWIHRKGATHAEAGMLGVIPGNMRDGSFIVEGLGNSDSLSSSSHGAGRVMSRKAAKQTLDMTGFEYQMEGITAKVEEGTLDESPLAYKSIFDVMTAQETLVKVLRHIKPIVNIKAIGK